MNTDRVVVVTGAAGGIGSLIVARFLANGDTVVATDTSDEALAKLSEASGAGAKLFTATADISDEASCDALADFAKSKAARVDVLINCAGYFPMQPFDELTLSAWHKVVNINLTGVFLMIKAMLPLMRGRGWGRIVNLGSGSMFSGNADQVPYVSAKAGVLGLTRSLARELGKDGITVNMLTPGLTLTPIVRKTMPHELLEAQIKSRAIPREEQGEDLVGTVFFLSSDGADFMTGQTLNVDGGQHMH